MKKLEKETDKVGANDDEYDYETLEKLQEQSAEKRQTKRKGLREEQLKHGVEEKLDLMVE